MSEQLLRHSQEKARKREETVLNAINLMHETGEKITFYSVAKKTKASKSYLYNNPKIACLIKEYRNQVQETSENDYQKQIAYFKSIIESLENENMNLRDNMNYKDKYFRLLAENKALKEQLLVAYSYDRKEN